MPRQCMCWCMCVHHKMHEVRQEGPSVCLVCPWHGIEAQNGQSV